MLTQFGRHVGRTLPALTCRFGFRRFDNEGDAISTGAPRTPRAEVEIDAALVRALLKSQFPDLAELDINIVESGWDNVMVRLGDSLAARLPRRKIADALLLNEQRWLPTLAPQLPLPIPAPLHCGVPTADYPFHWSVLPWLPGEAADLSPPDSDQAPVLAEFLRTLHGLPLPDSRPINPLRECPLSDKQPNVEQCMSRLLGKTDLLTPRVLEIWQTALATTIDSPRVWIAGDVHARNVLVNGGKLSAIIDWGDMCAGDPASDLASIWALFDDEAARDEAIRTYGMTEPTLARAKGWAVFYGVVLLETGLRDTPRHAEMGRAMLRRLQLA